MEPDASADIIDDLLTTNQFFNKESFERYVEDERKKYDHSYIDTVTAISEDLQIEYYEIKGLLSVSLTNKLKDEAIKNNLLKDSKKIRKTYLNLDEIFP